MSVLVAAALDGVLGEPRPGAHPVVWTGRYLEAVGERLPAGPPARAVALGGAGWLAGAVAAVALARGVDSLAARTGWLSAVAVRGAALWPLLSARMLLDEVAAVEVAVSEDLAAGRSAVSRIVGRDTTRLSASDVRGAALESLSENLSDSVVAPLFWYVVAGLPGAALYRFVNTADACWGYRTPRWEYAGRAAARADDVLNLLPARLTALLLARRGDLRRLPREARRTSSPNAGWPMAALALRLDRCLAKGDYYELNTGAPVPGPADVTAGLRAARRALAVAFAGAAVTDHLIRRHRGGRP